MQENVYNITYLFWKYYLWNLGEKPPTVETDDISVDERKYCHNHVYSANFEVEIRQNTITNLYLLYAIQITNVFTVLHQVLEVIEVFLASTYPPPQFKD